MKKLKAEEIKAEDGRMFAYVYTGDSSSFEIQRKAHNLFTGTIHVHSSFIDLFSGGSKISHNIRGCPAPQVTVKVKVKSWLNTVIGANFHISPNNRVYQQTG